MNPYQILGVDTGASQDDIKKAYRRLASQHHPDKGGDTKKFQEIQAAYETLSDPRKKSEYDNPSPFGQGPFGGWQQADMGGVPPGFEDIFNHIFSRNQGPFGRQQPRNRNINLETEISLEDAFTGKTIIASYTLPSGKNKTFEVKIPAGIHDGMNLKIPGGGDQTIAHLPPGDALLQVRIRPHKEFQLNGIDLIKQIEISVWDAMLGNDVDIKNIDGETITIRIKEGTQPGGVLRVHAKGMPDLRNNSIRGNLLLSVKIKIPTDLTEIQKSTIRSLIP
jgi:curved DNA-binding protein